MVQLNKPYHWAQNGNQISWVRDGINDQMPHIYASPPGLTLIGALAKIRYYKDVTLCENYVRDFFIAAILPVSVKFVI
jgi:hypothetical protein